ncbi:MAG: hypothetical protein ACLTOP_09190 [Collinsella phocaeensis]
MAEHYTKASIGEIMAPCPSASHLPNPGGARAARSDTGPKSRIHNGIRIER